MEILHTLFENSPVPFWSALILGIMTAISPCPLATNITAIGFIGRNLERKNKVFFSGLIYTLGRAFSYTSLGLILYFGASRFHIARIFQGWGERIIGFVLLIIGIFLLDVIRIRFPAFHNLTEKIGKINKGSFLTAFLLGAIFALAFCPYSGMLYFGLLIPITIASASGLYLPVIFALATGLPVIIVSWFLAYSMGGIGSFYNKVSLFQTWFNRVTAVAFIAAGLYYVIIFYIAT